MKNLIKLLAAAAIASGIFSVQAADGKDVKLTGEGTCAKCGLKLADKCQNVVQVKNGDKTTVLERAATKLKDNRLVPELFSTQHYSYDTSAIANVPSSDIDFNHDALGVEGSGSDIVHYHVPLNGYNSLIHVQARVWYQSAPPKWMEELFSNHSAPIDTFRTMYEAADNTPFLVAEGGFDDLSTGIDGLDELGVRVAPNPARDGVLNIIGLTNKVQAVEVFDVRGRLVAKHSTQGITQLRVNLPADGTYMVVFRTRARSFVQRVVALTPGHNLEVWLHPAYQALVGACLRWCAGQAPLGDTGSV